MSDTSDPIILALVAENAELRLQLAETQEQCIEMAVDAGELHAEIEALRAQLAAAERERNTWRAEAGRAAARRSAA
ncbi:hypothetical protein [Methylobacterium nigriterrae]|uniref:hypothetical protein n=1 Tax=Methylobacterium nigriterrae TaxID=3127512 RepID=UPI0030132217